MPETHALTEITSAPAINSLASPETAGGVISESARAALAQNGIEMTPYGLTFHKESEDVSFQDMCFLVKMFLLAENVSGNFVRACIGDLYNRIESRYGEKESQCEDVFGKGYYQVARSCGWVFGQSPLFPTPESRADFANVPYYILRDYLRKASPSKIEEWRRICKAGDFVSPGRIAADIKAYRAAQQEMKLEGGEAGEEESAPQWTGGAFGAVGETVAREVQAEAERPPVQALRHDSGEGDSHDAIEEADDGAAGNRTDLELLAIAPDNLAKLRAVFTALQMNSTGKAYDRLEDLAGSLFAFQYDSFVMKGLLHPDAWLDFKGR